LVRECCEGPRICRQFTATFRSFPHEFSHFTRELIVTVPPSSQKSRTTLKFFDDLVSSELLNEILGRRVIVIRAKTDG